MARRYYLPNPVNGVTDRTYRLLGGGTSARTGTAALTALKVLTMAKKGLSNNTVPLDVNALVPATYIPTKILSTLNVVGPEFALSNTSEEYTITDYDFRTQYTLTVIGDGTVVMDQDTITYTAPAQASTNGDGFTLNDVVYNITVGASTVKMPKIIAPTDLANNIPSTYTFITAPFVSLGETQAHVSSTWQIATDANFATIVQYSNADTVNKVSWTVTNLDPLTNYYARVKHTGSVSGDSHWSTTVRFQTGEHIPTALSQIIPAALPAYLGFFGNSVSVNNDGTVIAIGSPGNNGMTSDAIGRVFIYNKTETGWVLSQTLRDSITSNQYESEFGHTVKLNGAGTALLVSVRSYNNKGAVVLFTKTNNVWSASKRFYKSTVENNSYFGDAIAMNTTGTVVIIGAPGKTVNSNNSAGSIYVYRKTGNTWDSGIQILPEAVGYSYMFGSVVDCNLSGDTFVTSSYGANSTSNNEIASGIVYVYKYENSVWVLKQTIEKEIPISAEHFGHSVAMDTTGEMIVICDKQVTYENQKMVTQGNVYIYRLDTATWVLDATYTLPVTAGYVRTLAHNGLAMSKSGGVIALHLITTNEQDVYTPNVGIIREVNNVWTLKTMLSRPTIITESDTMPFGSIALTQTGDTCVVGADRDSYIYDMLIRSGLAYIYQ